ncbi:MAG: B12-binding domain-containing protein [Spirochaetales bacterium]|nr:B12-binding domain-containing protein [Leptospiraceae bacterium]MCP5481317.1 B12-binding domain-containing protein [Spirochaetales bacterium]MCP5485753.1 B12-binding domain-containing protein [Spirochaetales bacterium]
MISWCSYCQKYIGEKEPLEVYGMSHGICVDCIARGAFTDPAVPGRIRPIREFYQRLYQVGRYGRPADAPAILAEGRGMGLDPLDLLVGIVQPLQYEMGRAWERNEISVQQEHMFTATMQELVETVAVYYDSGKELRESQHPRFLLVDPVPGGQPGHSLGLRVVEAFLLARGTACRVVSPGIPVEELLPFVESCKPAFLGISITLPDTTGYARQVEHRLAHLNGPIPGLILGGYALRTGMAVADIPGVTVCRNLRQLDEVLQASAGEG